MTGTIAEQTGRPAYTHEEILKVLTGLLAALFTAMISTTIVSTALPTIMADLGGTQRQYTWVITSALLAMAITTPIWGKLADLFDKKVLVQTAIVLFVIGSLGAGAAQTIPAMMAFRGVQGLAMGGLTALVQAVLGTIIPPRQRGRYFGYMGAVMAVATVSGPLLGGVITEHLHWRWCFFVCLPLAIVAIVMLQATLTLPRADRPERVRIDVAGALLVAVAAGLPMLWVTFAGNDFAWLSWQSAAYLGGALLAAVVLVLVELRVPQPIIPLRVMRNRTTILMVVASIAVGVAMFGTGVFATQYFQLAGGHSPTTAGLMTIPLIIAQMLAGVASGQIVTRTGRWRPVMLVAAGMLVVGLGGLGLVLDHTTPYWVVAVFMAISGVGVGGLIQNIVLAVQNTVDVKDIGASSATIAFFRSVGGTIGVSILGAVLAGQVSSRIADGARAMGIDPSATGVSQGSLDVSSLPAPVQALFHDAYGDSFGLLFAIAGAASVLTLVAIVLVRETTLRTTVEMTREPATSDAREM
ncbi:MFS transporter [Ruania suaedae]|uniref:MFS transporter n=1 Tax=Ruania suaedae TaxID=2897774 RepID=UPI001E5B8AAF|nr:MFS transporter [Ruania suaedae]UFU02581.1 MFS transporter [Ruania suaedae]